jgi:hypothetical protein
MHYLSLIYAALTGLAVAGAGLDQSGIVAAASAGVFLCGWLIRFKYQGKRALRLYRLYETAGFTILPAIYLFSLVRGCFRFRSFGAFL